MPTAFAKILASRRCTKSNGCSTKSIKYGLDHRGEALDYALQYGRDLDRAKADRFVGMYVNDWTLDFGHAGREAVTKFLAMGYEQGVIPTLVVPEFVGG